MEFIIIGVVLAIIIVILTLIKLGIVTSVRITALYFDYVVISIFGIYLLHTLLSNLITDDKLVWFLSVIITILILIGYYILTIIINEKLPILSKILNYIVSLMGAIMATRLSIYIFKVIFGMFNDRVVANGDLTFFDSNIANKIIQLIFAAVLSIYIYGRRIKLISEGENI